jgi:hypothetical protein
MFPLSQLLWRFPVLGQAVGDQKLQGAGRCGKLPSEGSVRGICCHSSVSRRPTSVCAERNCRRSSEQIIPINVCFGSKADICAAKSDVRFTPNSDIDCVFRHDSHRAFNARGADHLYFAVFPVPPRKLPIVPPAHIANSTLDNMAECIKCPVNHYAPSPLNLALARFLFADSVPFYECTSRSP